VLVDGDWVESKDQDPNGEVRLTQLADIGDGVFRDRSDRFMTAEKADLLNCTFLEVGDVMVARMPDPLGRACTFPGSERPCVTVVDVCILRPSNDVNTRWLMNFINAPDFRLAISGLQAGSTRKRISKKNLCTIDLPVPPQSEQHRIVEAIESYFTRLDDAVATLERVERNLKRYRASVLKAAVEGRLVPTEAALAKQEGRKYEPASVLLERILAERRRRWAESGKKGKYQEPEAPDTTKLPELPEGWCWASLEQLAHLIRNGQTAAPAEEGQVPILRISAVRSMSVALNDVRYLVGKIEDYADDLVQVGDLLFTRYNGNPALVGVCGLVKRMAQATLHPDKLIEVRIPLALLSPSYIELACNAGESRRHLASRTRTTAGQAGISGVDLKQMPVPIPPLDEQRRIAQEVESLWSVSTGASGLAVVNRKRAQRLRQAILKWAFEGKLADQDPNDEPASVLLERIKAERSAAKPAKATRVQRGSKQKQARA
jgi:type I restriction enzyme S subunit